MKIAATTTVAALVLTASTPASGAIENGCDICSGFGQLVRDRTFLVPDSPDVGYTTTNGQVATAGYTNTCGDLSDAVNDETIGPGLGATCGEVRVNFLSMCCSATFAPCGMCSDGAYPPNLPIPATSVVTGAGAYFDWFGEGEEYTCRSLGFGADQLSTEVVTNLGYVNLDLCWNLQYAAAVECGCDSTPVLPSLACSICGDGDVVDHPLALATLPSDYAGESIEGSFEITTPTPPNNVDAGGSRSAVTLLCSAAQISFNYAGRRDATSCGQTQCSASQYCVVGEVFECVDCPSAEGGCAGDEACATTCFRPNGCLWGQTFAGPDCCDDVSSCTFCENGVENPDRVVQDPIEPERSMTCGEIKSNYTDLAAATQLCTDIINHAEAAGCVCITTASPTSSPSKAPTTAPTTSPTKAPTAVPPVDITSAQPSASPTAEIKATIIVSLAGVPNATMGSDDTGVFEDVFLELLKQELASQEVFITDVVVVNQDLANNNGVRALAVEGGIDEEMAAALSQSDSPHPRLLLVGSNQGRSLLSSSVLDVTTDVIGWYIPPPEKNLEELAEDSINANGDAIRQDLQNASATDYFDPVTGVSARQLPSETPSSSPSSSPTKDPNADDTSAASWNVRVGIFSTANIGAVCATLQLLLR